VMSTNLARCPRAGRSGHGPDAALAVNAQAGSTVLADTTRTRDGDD
jgi:hypothetical protein